MTRFLKCETDSVIKREDTGRTKKRQIEKKKIKQVILKKRRKEELPGEGTETEEGKVRKKIEDSKSRRSTIFLEHFYEKISED